MRQLYVESYFGDFLPSVLGEVQLIRRGRWECEAVGEEIGFGFVGEERGLWENDQVREEAQE